jgi:hypothetical protein
MGGRKGGFDAIRSAMVGGMVFTKRSWRNNRSLGNLRAEEGITATAL